MAPKPSPPHLNLLKSYQSTQPVDSPVFRFLPNETSHNYGTTRATTHAPRTMAAANNTGPWSAAEHERFLDGLEKYGCGQSTSVFAAWHAIAATVETRSLQDVKAHANRYYAQLQTANTQKRKEYLTMQQIDTRWTMHEDAQLEDELAGHIPVSITYPWESVARRVPGKSARDVRERYEKLCFDVSRIESGQHVMMHLGRYPRHKGMDSSPTAEQLRSNQHAHDNTNIEIRSIDCVVTLTPHETQILLRALEQVPVPSQCSPNVLAAVASAVAALACTKHRQPPRRVLPLFSLDDAREALQLVIEDEPNDPHDVLEILAIELQLLPVAPPLKSSETRRPERSSSIAASTGFAFGVSPGTANGSSTSTASYFLQTPVGGVMEREATRSAEDLLHLKTSPVHRVHGSSSPTGRRREQHPSQYDDDFYSGGSSSSAMYSFPTHSATSFPYAMPPSSSQGGGPSGYSIDSDNRSYRNSQQRQQQQQHYYRGDSDGEDSMDNYL